MADNDFGRFNDSSRWWSGAIGAVLRGEVDVALAPLAVTWKRMTAVEFTRAIAYTGVIVQNNYRDPFKESSPSSVGRCPATR